MKPTSPLVTAWLCLMLASTAAQSRDGAGTLAVGPDLIATGQINGAPARYQMLANGTATLVLNPDAAARFAVRAGWLNVRGKVGPYVVNGKTAVIRYTVAGVEIRHRIGWFERPISPGFDGALGPTAVPQDIVQFRLRPPSPGERRIVLPMADLGYRGVGVYAMAGAERIFVQWDLVKPHNSATAAAGADLALSHGGQFTGKPWLEPVGLGIDRPARRLKLARPFAVGPLLVDNIAVRTADYGDASAIPDADKSDDEEEVVVSARGKKSRAIHVVHIGRDAMAGCSSLTFDKPAKQIVLMCA